MEWSSDKPVERGVYWFRFGPCLDGSLPTVVDYDPERSRPYRLLHDDDWCQSLLGQWAGPIPEPDSS